MAEPVYRKHENDIEALEGAVDSLNAYKKYMSCEGSAWILDEIEAVERGIARLKADRDKEQP